MREQVCAQESDVDACAFTAWYPKFKAVTFPTQLISLDEEFVHFLQDDDIFLPESAFPPRKAPEMWDYDDNSWDTDDDESDGTSTEIKDESDTQDPEKPVHFPELELQIRAVLDAYNAVVPKLNWSTPRDAIWMHPCHSLKCTTPGEILLLLKSSDFVMHDLTQAYSDCTNPTKSRPETFVLALRKWRDVSSAMEFRCFVKDSALIAISQRDPSTFFRFLPQNQNKILSQIQTFYKNEVFSQFSLTSFTFDVYVDEEQNGVILVDFNPFGNPTDALLFKWSDFDTLENTEIRVVESEDKVHRPLLQTSRLPLDGLAYVDVSSKEAIAAFADLTK